jgi:hypothetical protein
MVDDVQPMSLFQDGEGAGEEDNIPLGVGESEYITPCPRSSDADTQPVIPAAPGLRGRDFVFFPWMGEAAVDTSPFCS